MKSNISFRYVLILFITISIIASLGSCEKSKEKKIVGTWELAPMNEYEQNNPVVWEFYDGTKLMIYKNDLEIDTANYSISAKRFKYFINISGLQEMATGLDGKYRIEKLTKDILIIHRVYDDEYKNDYFVRKEFSKQ